MRVEPKLLMSRLNTVCTSYLEEAVATAASSRFYEIVPEHFLIPLLREGDTDTQELLRHCAIDAPAISKHAQRALTRMRTGNHGRPVFAETLFQWVEDAWLLASLQFGAGEIRTGHLFMTFASNRHRYTGESYPELGSVPLDKFRKEFEDLTAHTSEAIAAFQTSEKTELTATSPTANREALTRFTTSFTDKARDGGIDPIFGRHREIRQLIEILSRRRKNNPIIVGEPGVGKTALVEGLALAVTQGDVPETLRDIEVLELDMGLLQAGASVRGEFEKRLKAVIDEVRSSPSPIVLFIDEAHTIVGKETDAANLLKPALARGELRTIAATTWSEYKKYFEKDAAFARRFQPVSVEEPSVGQALVMLRGLRTAYERTHGVTILDEALVAAATLSHRYIAGRLLPDKAIDLLDTAATRVRMEQDARPSQISIHEESIAAIQRELELLNRERSEGGEVDIEHIESLRQKQQSTEEECERLSAQWRQEQLAFKRISELRQKIRSGASDAEDVEQKRAAERELTNAGSERLIHSEVDADAIARVVETWTGIPTSSLESDTAQTLLTLDSLLEQRVRGQSSAIQVVAQRLRIAAAQMHDPDRPLGVLLFVGPSGVGKTETALALANLMYGGERFITTVNMSEFQEKHTVSRLIGSPPGYVGYGEGGLLTEAVRQRPYSVVLLDECEKADLEVMNLFYQVFDKGSLSDGEGREVNFRNTIIILTSNLASEKVMELGREGHGASDIAAAIRPTLSRHFKPALLARMTIVPFLPLSQEILREIVNLKVAKLQRRMRDNHGVALHLAPEALDQLAKRCSESESGARVIEHILGESLMPRLSQAILERLAQSTPLTDLRVQLNSGRWHITPI